MCKQNHKKDNDLSALLAGIFPTETVFYFAYPGRDTPEDSKFKIRRKLVGFIDTAKYRIDGFIYSLNDLDTLIALKKAKSRGVKITLLGDKDESYDEAEKFGIHVSPWKGSGIHHTKILFSDDEKVFLGTGNFSGHGLIRDNNVYWEWSLPPSEIKKFREHLEEIDKTGVFIFSKGVILFSPEAGKQIQDKILNSISNARHSIRYMIYTHYDPVISFALLEADKRGVRVEGIYNHPINPEGQTLGDLLSSPSGVYVDGNEDVEVKEGNFLGGLLHHKTMIIDDEKVLVGSYNYTVSARDSNREFFIEFSSVNTAKEFSAEWERVKSVATEYKPDPEEEKTSYHVTRMESGFLNSFLLTRQTGNSVFIDKNSSGLASILNTSLSITEDPFYKQVFPNRFQVRDYVLSSDFLWMKETMPAHSTWSFMTVWDKYKWVSDTNFQIRKLILWDGKKEPLVFYPDSGNDFDLSFKTKIAGENWIVLETNLGYKHICTKRKNTELPDWIQYLQQKQKIESKGSSISVCKEF
ncbi:phospholipase D-like domain-containing protein [Leptospira sp. 'Mane']|uniref:phospholipase D-like domain-containing protein n=1 Tax=Leptospira sp. 'Mane' TaxID=3387407 RepID=UPI00398AC09B